MNINRLLEITNDLEQCAFCPDEDCTDICARCDKVKPITAAELRRYFQQVRETLSEHDALKAEKTKKTPEAEKKLSFVETKVKCPFCEGENQNARIFEDKENKEFFEYCPVCGIETTNVFTSKAKAVKAFSDGKTKKIRGKETGGVE